MTKVHVFVSGIVQGVFYRAWTQKTALSLGLSGWIKNLPDGRVEAVFAGEEKKVQKMIDLLYQGTPASSVEKLEVAEREKASTDPFNGQFFIKR